MSGPKQYRVNEIFASIQGEGARAGTANVFIRFSGCNLTCRADGPEGFDCDTEFRSGRNMTAKEIAACASEVGFNFKWVILTGGEPALQVDDELIETLHRHGFSIAIETNGTKELPEGIAWICVSPKTAEHTLRVKRAHEIKYVRHAGQGIPRPTVEAEHKFISPAFAPEGLSRANLEWCIKLVKENTDWRLTCQLHKLWGVR